MNEPSSAVEPSTASAGGTGLGADSKVALIPVAPGVWPGVLDGLPFRMGGPGHHPNLDHRIEPWLDEQIWGHRIWDAQSPWLVFLEFLNVAEACERHGDLLQGGAAYPLQYRPRQRMFLRNILFNCDDIDRIASDVGDSSRAWAVWLEHMEQTALGAQPRDFGYLKERFHSFKDFAEAVRLVRGAVVERQTNKRWSSRFVFPFGPSALYIDANVNAATGQPLREYINFGRTGELLYCMLARSSMRDEVREQVRRMVAGTNSWDRLVAALQPGSDDDIERAGKSSYLPYLEHPVYDQLAKDWLAIGYMMPSFDGYPHLVTLAGLHILRFHLWVSSVWADSPGPPPMVCEIVAPRKTQVRELSLRSFGQNDALSAQAVERFVERIGDSEQWRSALLAGGFVECRSLLAEAVSWGEKYEGANQPDALLAELQRVARKGHQQHVAQVHRAYGREIGLVSRRGTTRLRYAPTDQLIKTLLFASVERRMEFGDFLDCLYTKYGLVIGDREAEQALQSDEFDRKPFRANARRLEQRLGSLGLVRRLSDACAYVENPYAKGKG